MWLGMTVLCVANEALVTIFRGPRTRICWAVETDSSRKGFSTWRPLQYWEGSTHYNPQDTKDLLAENLQIVWLNVNYHFEVALSFAGLIGAEAQLAVDVELTHIGIVLGNLSKWIEWITGIVSYQRNESGELTWKLNPPSVSLRSVGRICTDKSAGQVLRMRSKRGGCSLSELLDTQHFSVTIWI